MRPKRLTVIALLLACCLCLGACKHTRIDPEAVEALHSGAFDVENGEDIANSFYVDVQGQTEGLDGIVAETEAKLRLGGYQITNNPSKAGHILHLNILHTGPCAAEEVRSAVSTGYGNRLSMKKGEATGLVADALLVQRRIPTHKRPSFVRLKNISNRNAVGNSQMRFGLLLPSGTQNLPPAFVEVLSRELASALQLPTQALQPRQEGGRGRAK